MAKNWPGESTGRSDADDRWALLDAPAEPASPDPAASTSPRAATPGGPFVEQRPARPVFAGARLITLDPEGRSAPRLALWPMTVADILDGAFAIIKARPARLLGMTAALVIPVYLLGAWLQRDALSGLGLMDILRSEDTEAVAEAEDLSAWTDVVAPLLVWMVLTLVQCYVAAVIAHLLGAWASGRDPSGRDLLRMAGRRSWALIASFVVVHLAEGVGLLACYIGAAFVMPFFVATAPVIGAEGAGPMTAIRRSARLAAGRYWPTLGISLLIGVGASVLSVTLGGLPALLSAIFGFDLAWPLVALGNIVGAVVVTPFVAAATVLLYLDLRVRAEGLDLELAARDQFAEMAA